MHYVITSEDQQVMSDLITSMKIVDHNGDVKEYLEDTQSIVEATVDAVMNAVRVSMGVLGVVVEMILKVEDSVWARVDTSYPTVRILLYGNKSTLVQLLHDYWSVEILWFPFNSLGTIGGVIEGLPLVSIWQPKTDEVWVRAINRDPDKYCEANRYNFNSSIIHHFRCNI